MKIIFLGTNGWYTTSTGNTPSILIDSKDHYIVLDAGNGIYKLDKYILEEKPISLFVSHFHIDHVSGFHTLPKFNFLQGIDIYIAEGRKKDFEILVNPPYTIGYLPNPKNIGNLRTEIRLHELPDGISNIPFSVEPVEQFHAYRDHGYRFMLEGKIIAYSGDCGLSDGNLKLARSADILIHESTTYDKPNNIWGHLDPVTVSKIAKEANVKKLILTHFDASIYETLEKRKMAEKKAREIFPNTIAATDDLIIEV